MVSAQKQKSEIREYTKRDWNQRFQADFSLCGAFSALKSQFIILSRRAAKSFSSNKSPRALSSLKARPVKA